jgi:hypothetical protein
MPVSTAGESMVVLYAARHRVPVPCLARCLLGLGIAATLTANMAQGWSHGLVGAVVAAWPTVSLVGSYELLVWLIRTSGTVEHRPPTGHRGDAAARRAAPRSARTAAIGAEFPRRGERGTPDQARQPSARVARPPAIPVSGHHYQAVPEVGAVNDAAVAAYRLSAQAGNPLSERKLAQMFGRTSRRWARARIAEARSVPCSRLMEDPAITVGARSPVVAPQARAESRRSGGRSVGQDLAIPDISGHSVCDRRSTSAHAPQLKCSVRRPIAALEQAGYRNSECSLPVYASGGAFSAIGGGEGVNVTAERWDATEAELGELRAGIVAALRAAGLKVREPDTRIYVPPVGLEDAAPAT